MEKNVRSTNPAFLTRKEAAKKLRISEPTLDRHIADNKLQSVIIGRRRLIPQEQFDTLIQKGGDK